MKKSLLIIAACTMFAGSAFAQTAAPAAAPAAAAAAATGVCKDGSAFSAATTKGACRGHGGIDKKAGAAAAAPGAAAATPMAKDAAPAKPTTAATAATKTPAAGGGAGKVWANDTTKVYHCEGDKYYGMTKKGEYMTEADAKTKGFHADHGNVCTK